MCWSFSVLVRAARCPSWCDTAPPARENLLLAFGSFNFHKHLEGGHRSKCGLAVQRAGSCGVLVCEARCPLWCDTAPAARGNLMLAFGSFNFHKHLEGRHRSKCVFVMQRAGSCGDLSVVV